jgi:transposase
MRDLKRYELTDEQWERITPLLPPQKPQTGRPNNDHRQTVNGIIWVLKRGASWRDLPERYGKVGTVSSRFYRWVAAGIWQRVLTALQGQTDDAGAVDWELHLLDGSIVRAHQHTAGAKKVTLAARRSDVVVAG